MTRLEELYINDSLTTDTWLEFLQVEKRLSVTFPRMMSGSPKYACFISDGVLGRSGQGGSHWEAIKSAYKNYSQLLSATQALDPEMLGPPTPTFQGPTEPAPGKHGLAKD